ncbi:beta strand repeat-containing protein, partial [Acinetobacter nectaris]|uniref:beta strand repeat-containing protein n=1 Tax=Acinetobacter nectaris TaxID=1219382 RepID=UPI001F30F406
TAEAGSTVTVTYPDGSKGTVVAGNDGSYSVTSTSVQTSGAVSATATDKAGNVSPVTTNNFVMQVYATDDPTSISSTIQHPTTTSPWTDSAGSLLNIGTIVYNSSNTISVAANHITTITGDVSVTSLTSAVGNLFNLQTSTVKATLQIYKNGSWSNAVNATVSTNSDGSLHFSASNAPVGTYRVHVEVTPTSILSFINFLPSFSTTATVTDYDLTKITSISGSTNGNVMSDTGSDRIDNNTTVTSVSSGGNTYNVTSNGVTIVGTYGSLTINSSGSYTYTLNGSSSALGNTDSFSYTISNGTSSSTANLNIAINNGETTTTTSLLTTRMADDSVSLLASLDTSETTTTNSTVTEHISKNLVETANTIDTTHINTTEATTSGNILTETVSTSSGYTLTNIKSEESSSFTFGKNGDVVDTSGTSVSTNGSVSINGLYGTLVIASDGSYTYTLHSGIDLSNITSKEVFNYSLTDSTGKVSASDLTINLETTIKGTTGNDVIHSTPYNDTLTLGSGTDTLVYKLLNSSDAAGGNGHDTWTDFSVGTTGDKIDITSLLSNSTAYSDVSTDTNYIGNYVKVQTVTNSEGHTDTVVSIDRDGSGTTYNATELLTLSNTNTSLDELLKNHQLLY